MKLSYRMLFFLIPLLSIFFSNCQKSQESEEKQTLTINDIWISDVQNLDGDDFVSEYRLNFDLDINQGSKEVFIWIGWQFYDEADTAQTYYEYIETVNLTVESGEENAWNITIGGLNGELAQAGYDFLFIVHDASEPDTRLAEASEADDDDLFNIPIETVATDVGVVIFDAWFDNFVDLDGDGYNSKATLYVDADASEGSSAEVQLALYEKMTGSSDYNPIYLTPPFIITGVETEDIMAITLSGFESGSYDFMVELIFSGSRYWEDKKEAADWPDIGGIKLELASNDEPSFKITFNNLVYTDMDITISGYGTKVAPPGGYTTFTLPGNPGSFTFHAETAGYTTGGTRIGKLVTWDYPRDVSDLDSATINLGTTPSLFFLRLQNSGTVDLSPLVVNYGLPEQIQDNIVIPMDGKTYRIGYYDALPNTQIRAYWYDGTGSYTYWDQGVDFTLSTTQFNQFVNLSKTNKTMTNTVESNEISSTISIGNEKPLIDQTSNNNFKNFEQGDMLLGKAAKD